MEIEHFGFPLQKDTGKPRPPQGRQRREIKPQTIQLNKRFGGDQIKYFYGLNYRRDGGREVHRTADALAGEGKQAAAQAYLRTEKILQFPAWPETLTLTHSP